MKNIFGTQEDLRLYHENGKLAYTFYGVFCQTTYDDKGNQTSCKDPLFIQKTFDNQGTQISYKDSSGFSSKATFDDQNRMTSYKNSLFVSWERIYNEDGTYEQIDL